MHAHRCGEGPAHCAGPLTAGALSCMFPVCRTITHKTPVDLERPGITSSICFKLWERLSHSTSSCIGIACSQAALLHQQQSEPATEVLPVRRIWCLYGVPLLAKQWFARKLTKPSWRACPCASLVSTLCLGPAQHLGTDEEQQVPQAVPLGGMWGRCDPRIYSGGPELT